MPQIIYFSPLSQPARAVTWYNAYAKKGFETKPINLLEGEQKAPEYLEKFPHGKVPSLEDGDFFLEESAAILGYLADGDAVVPAEPKEAARVNQMIARHLSQARKFSSEVVYHMFFAPDDKKADLIKQGIEKVSSILKSYDAILEKSKFVCGENVSLADFLFVPEVDQFQFLQPLLGTNVLEPFKNITAYLDRVKELEGYADNRKAAEDLLAVVLAKKAEAAAK